MIKVLIADLSVIENTGIDIASFIRSHLHESFVLADHVLVKNKLLSGIGYMMCQRLLLDQGIDAKQLHTLRKGKYGKWELPIASVDFNISHSGNKMVAAITNQGKVGVDIEEIRSIEWEAYKECFDNEQWNTLSQSTHPQNTFFDLWTKKESLSKAYGEGLQMPLNQIRIHDQTGYVGDRNKIGYFYPLLIPAYSGCVCATEPQQMEVQVFSHSVEA